MLPLLKGVQMLIIYAIGIVIALQWIHLAVHQHGNARTDVRGFEPQVAGLGMCFLGAVMLWLHVVFSTTEPAGTLVLVLGLASAIFGSVLRILGIEEIGKGFSWGSEAPKTLITSGIYSGFKHPLIVGYVLEVNALALSGTAPIALQATVAILAVIFALVQMRKEEEMLEQRFGAEWTEYAKGKFI